jgi:uncharacterized membrane protein
MQDGLSFTLVAGGILNWMPGDQRSPTLLTSCDFKPMELDLISTGMASAVLVLNGILISLCQLLAIFVIAVGIVRALIIYLNDSLFKPQTPESFQRSRLAMGYTFSLGLSFLIGSTIMKTMVSSQWEDIVRLVTIIGIRTALNLLLERAIARSATLTPQSSPTQSLAADGECDRPSPLRALVQRPQSEGQ